MPTYFVGGATPVYKSRFATNNSNCRKKNEKKKKKKKEKKKKSKRRFGAIFWEEFAVGAEKILIIIGSSAEKLWEQTDLTALQFFWAKSAQLFGRSFGAASRGPSPLAPRVDVPWRC